MRDDNNPRAFPSIAIDDKCGGMDLRDWFAGQALATAVGYAPEDMTTWGADDFAKHAYLIADAMLAERQRRD